jgi:hypothetical protein
VPVHSLIHYVLLECLVLVAALAAARWRLWLRVCAAVEGRARRLADRPALTVAVIFAAVVVFRVALLPIWQAPQPVLHDEFSYLFAADTFTHGRLTNPTPPQPAAFETVHINVWPTWQSMYMPGNGLALAAGQIAGCPWIAVLLATAGFCASVFWMVCGWLPRSTALLVAFLAAMIACTGNWWFDNYFCIGLPVLAGCLVLGSLPRILRRKRWSATLPLTIGLAMLMLTRPWEGAMLSLPCVLVLLTLLRRAGWKRIASLAVLPLAGVVACGAWITYYNWRGTGSPWVEPYVLNYRRYHITGPFIFSHLRPIPAYRHASMRVNYVQWELTHYFWSRHHPFRFLTWKFLVDYHVFLLGCGFFLLAGAGLLLARRRKRLLWAPLLALAVFCVQTALMAWRPAPQYGAPAASLLLLLVGFGIYRMQRLRLPGVHGANLLRGYVLAEVLLAGSVCWGHVLSGVAPSQPFYSTLDRPRIVHLLLSHPGRQLCLVRYASGDPGPDEEWLYNRADLADARIVWARSIDNASDRAVIAAFPARQVWLLQPNRIDAGELTSYFPRMEPALSAPARDAR